MRRIFGYPLAPVFFWILLPCVGGTTAPGRALQAQTRSYQEMRAEVVELYEAERFSEAARILSEALEVYPGHLMANTVNLALMRVRMGKLEESIQALEYGLEHGIWYGKYSFFDSVWTPMKEHEAWPAFQLLNQEKWGAAAKAAESAEPRLEVVLPREYDSDRSYPLFLALHGGGENVDLFLPNWVSPMLEREFIVAFPQSTQLVAMDGYNWTEDMEVTISEIQRAFKQVVAEYSVDADHVIVGGFSSGGVAALEVVLQDALPVQGFVVLCPAMPEGFTPEAVRTAAERGIRGTLLTTEMDGRVDQQRRMADIMREVGLGHEFHITPDIGHWYPDDLGTRIDRAIAHIRRGR